MAGAGDCVSQAIGESLSDASVSELERRQIEARGFTEDEVKFLAWKRRNTLVKLEVLSGGTTTAVPDGSGLTIKGRADTSTPMGRALAASPGAKPVRSTGSRMPPGVGVRDNGDMTTRSDGPPSKNFDLLGHYRWKFVYAQGDYHLTNRICAEADRDIERETGRSRDSNEDTGTRDAYILLAHEGEPPWHVAVYNDCSPEYVRRLRVTYGRSPQDGTEREESAVASGMPEEDRTTRIVRLKATGCSLRVIGLEVGLSHEHVRRILSGA